MAATEQAAISNQTCVFRNTGARKGRHLSITPQTAASRHMYFGRIVLDHADAPIEVETGERETGLICLRGGATVETGDNTFTMGKYDALYVPRASRFRVTAAADGCDFAELSAPVTKTHPLQFVSFAEVQKDPGLHFSAGAPNAERTLNILLGKNVEAGRIVAGVTFSKPGNWTSWPPHEHAAMLEEAYLYVDMPAPSFGVQFVYNDTKEPELATFVREGDVVVMPQGYHPNVAAPGGTIGFLWMMAANREDADRQFGVVNVQPEFSGGGSGLEKGQAGK